MDITGADVFVLHAECPPVTQLTTLNDKLQRALFIGQNSVA